MKDIYDPKTSDLTVILSQEEARKFRPDSSCSPVLEITTYDKVFHFLFTVRESQTNMTVKESHPDYWITIGLPVYRQLLREEPIGTRYFVDSKIIFVIDEELSQPNP